MAVTDRLAGTNQSLAVKGACTVRSTGNITLSSTQLVDGIAVGNSERILVAEQTVASENGIYISSNSTWIRSKDFDGSRDAIPGTLVYVDRGDTYADTFWVSNSSSTAPSIAIGNDDVAWSNITPTLADTSGGLVTATGSTVPRRLDDRFAEVFNVLDYGAVAEGAGGAIVHDEIMGAMDAAEAAGGGIVWAPPAPSASAYYRINKPLYARDNVHLVTAGPSALIYNDLAAEATFGDTACWMWGNHYNDLHDSVLTSYPVADVLVGENQVTLDTIADAADFAVGDLLLLRSGAHYDNASSDDVYHYYLIAKVISSTPGTGVVVMDRPVREALATVSGRSPSIVNLNESNKTSDFGDPVFASYRAGLHNVYFKSNKLGMVRGGALEPSIDGLWIDARDGIYGNLYGAGEFRRIRARVWNRAIELAMGCHDLTVDNLIANYWNEGSGANTGFQSGEGVRDCLVKDFKIDYGTLNPSAGPVVFGDCNNILLRDGEVSAPAYTGSLASWVNSTANTPNDPDQRHVIMDNVTMRGGAGTRYWFFSVGAGLDMKYNGLRNCNFFGAVSDSVGRMDGDGNFAEDNWHENETGGIQLQGTATACRIRRNFGIGEWSPVDPIYEAMAANLIEGNHSGVSQLARAATIHNFVGEDINSTTSGNDITNGTATFPATALQLGDRITVEVFANIVGTNDVKTVQLTDDTGALVTSTIAAGDTGPVLITGTIDVRGNTAYYGKFEHDPANDTPIKNVVNRTGLDLDTNGRIFTAEAWVDNASDTIQVESVIISIEKPGMLTRVA